MAFVIKPIDRENFNLICTPSVAEQLDKFIYATRNWADDLSDRTWATDEDLGACLLAAAQCGELT